MARFHLSFEYQNARGGRSHGDQVVIVDTLEEAARWMARERGLKTLHVRKRYFSGKPASEAEVIERTFDFGGAS